MRLIEKGLGKKIGLKDDTGGFEVVPRETDEEMHVHRVHDGEDGDGNYEDIDSDDDDEEDMANEYVERGKRNRLPREKPTAEGRVMTLALGTLMLNTSRKKALIDASYNRYSWSDSSDLPSWFTEDENRHNKPQVPVPAALVDQV
jgi:AdoMet-dependent rRNA methyltransferase SPB1